MKCFEGRTANEVWLKIAQILNQDESLPIQPSRAGETVELLHAGIEIQNPKQRWVVSREPPINPAFALAEVVWIINGSDNASIINHWNPILPKYVGEDAHYYGAYGNRLSHSFGFDQLRQSYLTLKNNPESRQVVLQLWSPEKDFPDELGQPRSQDIPCNICSLLKIRNGKLEWTQIMRSNDLFLGLPYNIVQFTFLQEILAGWLGVEVGSYNHFSDSLHFYLNDLAKLSNLSPIKVCGNTDQLAIPRKSSLEQFKLIFQAMLQLSSRNCNIINAESLYDLPLMDEGFKNLYSVILADSLRRHSKWNSNQKKKWINLAEKAMERVSNPVYRQMWNRWFHSTNKCQAFNH